MVAVACAGQSPAASVPYVVVAPSRAKAKTAEVYRPWDVAKPIASRDLHGPIRAGVVKTARQVRPSSDGIAKR